MSPHRSLRHPAPTAACCFRSSALCAALALSMLHPGVARAGAATLPTGFSDTSMASGLNLVVGLAEVPDPAAFATRRVLFVEQKTARVGLLAGGTVYTVGTVPGVSTTDNERGLLGIAVDPGFPLRPYIYTHSTDSRSGNHIAISRFTLTGDLAYTGTGQLAFDASTRYDLRADFPDNAGNHNGGTVHFGPDGMLYVSLGDDATYCPALDLKVAAGKILRLDVSRLPASGSGPAPYSLLTPANNPFVANTDSIARIVWADGLRNPFRFSVDGATGALVIGDVGLDTWEELDIAGTAGLDFEWPLYEGPDPYTSCALTPTPPMTGPIAYYDHTQGSAIVGGPRYRRPTSGALRFPTEYEGNVFYLEYYTGFMRRLALSGGNWVPASAPGQPNATDWATGLGQVSDMQEFSDGALWYCRQYAGGASTGEIRRIAYVSSVGLPPGREADLRLETPRPNPSRGSVTIAWTQPRLARTSLAVFGADGRRVRLLLDAERPGGPHTQAWDGLDGAGRRVQPGHYFVRLDVAGDVLQTKLALLR